MSQATEELPQTESLMVRTTTNSSVELVEEDFLPGSKLAGSVVSELLEFRPDGFAVVMLQCDKVTTVLHRNFTISDGAKQIQLDAEVLMAQPLSNLPHENIRSFLRMVGWAMAAGLDNRLETAAVILKSAKDYLDARKLETARWLYIFGSTWALIIGAALAVILSKVAPKDSQHLDKLVLLYQPLSVAIAASFAGCLGAGFFSLIRRNNIPLDSAAFYWTHYADGAIRIAVGGLSGLIALLAIKAQLIGGPNLVSSPDGYPLTPMAVLICLVAGVSERLVPSLIERVDTTTTTSADTPPKKPS